MVLYRVLSILFFLGVVLTGAICISRWRTRQFSGLLQKKWGLQIFYIYTPAALLSTLTSMILTNVKENDAGPWIAMLVIYSSVISYFNRYFRTKKWDWRWMVFGIFPGGILMAIAKDLEKKQ